MQELAHSCRRAATECACLSVRAAARVITQRYDAALAPVGLKATQFSVMAGAGLFEAGVPIGALARRLVIDRTTLTRNLAVLEHEGLVEIAVSADDARTKRVRLTAKGRRTMERAVPLWEKAQEQLRADLGAGEWEALRARLASVIALTESTR